MKPLLSAFCCVMVLSAAPHGQQPAQTPQPQPAATISNADVIAMVTAGLSEPLILTAIRQAPSRTFDVTAAGLIGLKKANVSDAVIAVMQGSAASTAPAAEQTPAAPVPSQMPSAQEAAQGMSGNGASYSPKPVRRYREHGPLQE